MASFHFLFLYEGLRGQMLEQDRDSVVTGPQILKLNTPAPHVTAASGSVSRATYLLILCLSFLSV